MVLLTVLLSPLVQRRVDPLYCHLDLAPVSGAPGALPTFAAERRFIAAFRT
jgi:hypothetical protein